MKRIAHAAAAALAGLALMAGTAQAADSTAKPATPSPAELKAKAFQEEQAKAVVLSFWHDVFERGDLSKVKNYYAPDIVQHNPIVPGGVDGFVKAFSRRFPKPVDPDKVTPTKFVAVTADGDLVTLVAMRPRPEPTDPDKTYESFWFDMFRVKNGMIVEHWDPQIKPAASQPGR